MACKELNFQYLETPKHAKVTHIGSNEILNTISMIDGREFCIQ